MPRAPPQSLKCLLLSEDNQTIVGIPWGPKDPRFSINGKISRVRTLNDGLSQGSVPAPALIKLYVSDLPTMTSFKLAYVDDIALVAQGPDLKSVGNQLTQDLGILEEYLHKWKLGPKPQQNSRSGEEDF